VCRTATCTWLEADYGADSSVLSHRLRLCSSIEGTPTRPESALVDPGILSHSTPWGVADPFCSHMAVEIQVQRLILAIRSYKCALRAASGASLEDVPIWCILRCGWRASPASSPGAQAALCPFVMIGGLGHPCKVGDYSGEANNQT